MKQKAWKNNSILIVCAIPSHAHSQIGKFSIFQFKFANLFNY